MSAGDRPAPFNQPVSFTGYVTQQYTKSPVDIRVIVGASRVLCVGVAGQGGCEGDAGSVYNGKLLIRQTLRITDHAANCEDFSNYSCPGTVDDYENRMGVQCAAGNCSATTSFNAVIPGLVTSGDRAVFEESQLQVDDGGLNGELVPAGPHTSGICPPACDPDDVGTLFLTQGMFAP